MNGDVPFLGFVVLIITYKKFLEEHVVILLACHYLQPGQSLGNPSRNLFPSPGCCFYMACVGLEIAGDHIDRACEHAHAGHMGSLGSFGRLRSAKSVD